MASSTTKPKFTNRLAGETSPYLLQHAHNPVDWFPWGPEAFEEARRRDVPIFLSIGYSTCYWCHVMERESFEHEPTAAILNERFVPVKLDREERPDIDEICMGAVQMLTGHGGWPMSVFLTPPGGASEDDPGLRPFWGGTYFPREPRSSHPSFAQVMEGMSDAWTTKRADVLHQSELIADALRERLAPETEPAQVDQTQVGHAVGQLMQMYDGSMGGFGGSPKFPQPVFLEFLLDVAPTIREDEPRVAVLNAVKFTLERMALGGVFDQVGGGFHRYSVDREWLVPHFEKMLYDNGQLAGLYARAAVIFEDDLFARTARRTCEYALREMRGDHGAFFSAQDAEVNHREGQNYIWRMDEIRAALNDDDAAFAIRAYGLDQGTNFRDPHHPDDEPANVLRLAERPESLASRFNMDAGAFPAKLDAVNEALYEARSKRDQPLTDDKVIVAWNGLMIAGLADAGLLLSERAFVDAAANAATFILTNMRDDAGGLLRVWRDGKAKTEAFLEDYAMFIRGLIALHRAGAGDEFRDAAIELADKAAQQFGDDVSGGFFDTQADQSDLFVRTRVMHDGAMPSGSSVMIHNLLDLAAMTGESRFRTMAGGTLASLSRAIAETPVGPIEATRGLLRVVMSDRPLLDEYGMGDAAPRVEAEPFAPNESDEAMQDDAGEPDDQNPVQVYANVEEASVGEDASAEIELAIKIADGWHINAHEPGVEGMVGLDVRIVGGVGVVATVDYPAGEPLKADWASEDARPLVHESAVYLTVRLERSTDAWQGEPRIVVRYQACTDRSCAEPQVVVLGIDIRES